MGTGAWDTLVAAVPWQIIFSWHTLAHLILIAGIIALKRHYLPIMVTWSIASISTAGMTKLVADHRNTVEGFIRTTVTVIAHTIILFLILDLFGVDVVPILVSAGFLGIIAGLVVNSTVQSLLKEIQAWFRIVNEDQYRIGDEIKVNGFHEGVVKNIGIQLTTMQGEKGEFTILNSTIGTVENRARKPENPPTEEKEKKAPASRSALWRIVRERRRGRRPWKRSI